MIMNNVLKILTLSDIKKEKKKSIAFFSFFINKTDVSFMKRHENPALLRKSKFIFVFMCVGV